MPRQALKMLVLLFLWGALLEDATIFVLAWLAPDLWFRWFHDAAPAGLEVPLLRRAAGQWLAFAVVQGLAAWRWQSHPIWLVVVAGARASDLFTDVSYLLAVPSVTTPGWAALGPPPLLNAAFIVVMALAYRQAQDRRGGSPRRGRSLWARPASRIGPSACPVHGTPDLPVDRHIGARL